MRDKTIRGKAYVSLIRTLFLQTLLMFAAAALIIVWLREVFRGRLADFIVKLICRYQNVDWLTGAEMYHFYVGNHIGIVMIVAVLVTFVILLRISLSLFTRYFDQIVRGIDQLSNEVDEPIEMSPKLKFIETTLNESKRKLKTREKAARDAEQRKNEVVVYLAHDIKTPLTSVIGYLSILDEAPDMPEEQRKKYTHIALEKAGRLETLINEFFEITRYNVNDVPLNKADVNLLFLFEQITEELYPKYHAHGNEVELHVVDDMTVRCDPDKMARALNNIFKNAVAYSYPDTPITITGEQTNASCTITFQNKGPTIPEEKLATIFEKFYRLDDARISNTGGAGLGLSIAREIIRRHGGTITARSENETIIFIVTLPVTD